MGCPQWIGRTENETEWGTVPAAWAITDGGSKLLVWEDPDTFEFWGVYEYDLPSLTPTGRFMFWGGPAWANFIADDDYNLYYWSDTYLVGATSWVDFVRKAFPSGTETVLFSEPAGDTRDHNGTLGYNPYDGYAYHLAVPILGPGVSDDAPLRQIDLSTGGFVTVANHEAEWGLTDAPGDLLTFTPDNDVWWFYPLAAGQISIARYDLAADPGFVYTFNTWITNDASGSPIPYDENSVLVYGGPTGTSPFDDQMVQISTLGNWTVPNGNVGCVTTHDSLVPNVPAGSRGGSADVHSAPDGTVYMTWPTLAGLGTEFYRIGRGRWHLGKVGF